MDELEIYERLAEIFEDVFDEDSIKMTPELSAKDVDGWDSLTHIRLMLTSRESIQDQVFRLGNRQAGKCGRSCER